jgi:hypothetical protein
LPLRPENKNSQPHVGMYCRVQDANHSVTYRITVPDQSLVCVPVRLLHDCTRHISFWHKQLSGFPVHQFLFRDRICASFSLRGSETKGTQTLHEFWRRRAALCISFIFMLCKAIDSIQFHAWLARRIKKNSIYNNCKRPRSTKQTFHCIIDL